MDFDIAKISPAMSRERLQGNHAVAIIKLARKTMEKNAGALLELMESVPAPEGGVAGQAIDIKL